MEFLKLLEKRASIRRYQLKPIERDKPDCSPRKALNDMVRIL